jgi:hypothetical protein
VGYSALIHKYRLSIPLPDFKVFVASNNRSFESSGIRVLPAAYLPEDRLEQPEMQALYAHLVFALKYEGVHLPVFSKLREHLSDADLLALVEIEPSGQYSRRIWFLLEWVSGSVIPGKPDAKKKQYVPALNEAVQFGVAGIKSPRHLVRNNLPGLPHFCPLIRKTPRLLAWVDHNYPQEIKQLMKGARGEALQRATAYLLVKDSKASFALEGEKVKASRAARWGAEVAHAGARELTVEELTRLQELVLEGSRFVAFGLRKKGGFVGEHDPRTGEPLPEHISARPEDLDDLMGGLLEAYRLLLTDSYHPVLAAAAISFGFVFIHPFQDGNGRLHRYLIHHVMAQKGLLEPGTALPISSAILEQITQYQAVLEAYSKPLLPFVEWNETRDHNVSVTNDTLDFYRFFDATHTAEFLFSCVDHAVRRSVPEELDYLKRYDRFRSFAVRRLGLPEAQVPLLLRFLEQNNGKLSKRAREREFSLLTKKECSRIERKYAKVFLSEEQPPA